MRYMTGQEIRETWLNFFKSKGHLVEPSASLIPVADPTLLWINAGIAPLKKYFDGSEKPKSPRITNVQKCIRTNDIDNVGRTVRHHTFFEMLGNFSIGDYFKEDAIKFGYEILTDVKWFGFPKEKLYVTYYPDDMIARDTWIKCGISADHLIPLEGNFWEIGAGPSGPDTEIFFDRGQKYDRRGKELIEQDIENDRFIEIWNIVFSQYNANPEVPRSQYLELPSKNIDTGGGLERFACILQGTKTNFETDLFYPIILKTESLTGVKYTGQMAFKVIADHIKTLTFAISDGAILSNEGRGYVLRRILRRAIKYGRNIGLNQPFLSELVSVVVEMMSPFYPNLVTTEEIVKKIVSKEEEKFLLTIADGEKHLIASIIDEKLSGEAAFKLYDTYGFPIELTLEYAQEHHIKVDVDGFYQYLKEQKERSRNARHVDSSMKSQEEAYLNFTEDSQFIGYDRLQKEAEVIAKFKQGIVLNQTPFYATMGGQVADKGTINGLVVNDVIKLPHGQHLHILEENDIEVGDEVLAIVDKNERFKINKNHTATHLLHQALKDVLGKHVNQQGSWVSGDILRFDFNHYEALKAEDILKIEQIVKEKILSNLVVNTKEMALDEAKKLGAMALFGEKYGALVRVVDIGGYSIELCGGTHVGQTKDIEDFAIVSIESIGSGIFRCEAITGKLDDKMFSYVANTLENAKQLITKAQTLDESFKVVKAPSFIYGYQDILNYRSYLERIKSDVKTFEKEFAKKEELRILSDIDKFIPLNPQSKEIVITHNLPNAVLKQLIDAIYDKIKVEVLILVNMSDDKVTYLVRTLTHDARAIVKALAAQTNGSGGGSKVFAQGGTQHKELVKSALEVIKKT